jgi:hypothetical protein
MSRISRIYVNFSPVRGSVRVRVRHMVFPVTAALLVGCSAGSSASTTSHPVTTSSSSAGTVAHAMATPSAMASGSQGLLGVLPVPAGARPWTTNTNALISRISYVESTYIKSVWTQEEALAARRGFVSAVEQGWANADGSQQYIVLVRFASPIGATSALDEEISNWKQSSQPMTMLTDPATGGHGWSSPALDSQGDAHASFYVAIGDTMIRVVEYTAATPDPAAAKALLQEQYDRLKKGS